MRTPLTVFALVAVLVTPALAGCADDGDTNAAASGAASRSASASATADPSSTPSAGTTASESPGTIPNPGDTLLIFSRQGGLAGTSDRLVVRPDGSWSLQTRTGTKTGMMTAAEVSALKAALDAAHFTELPRVNDGGTVADGYTYSITYAGHEVVAQDGAVPPALQPILGTLNGLLNKQQ